MCCVCICDMYARMLSNLLDRELCDWDRVAKLVPESYVAQRASSLQCLHGQMRLRSATGDQPYAVQATQLRQVSLTTRQKTGTAAMQTRKHAW